MHGVLDMFKKGEVDAWDLRRLVKDKQARDQARQLLMFWGTAESVEVLWDEYDDSGDREVLEYLSGAMAGVYEERYKGLLVKLVEKAGRRKDTFNAEVNALIVLGLHGEEEARPQLERIAADYSLRLLSETAERSLSWMEGKYYRAETGSEVASRKREVKQTVQRFFGPGLNFSPVVFNHAGDRAYLNFSCRGEGYNALLGHGSRGWYIAGIWFRYIV